MTTTSTSATDGAAEAVEAPEAHAKGTVRNTNSSSDSLGPLGVLKVHLQCAEGLRSADSNGKSDPFAVISVEGRADCKWTSKTCYKTLDPVWNQGCEFPGFLSDFATVKLRVRIYDFDLTSLNDPLGGCDIPLNELGDAAEASKGCEIFSGSGIVNADKMFAKVPLQKFEKGVAAALLEPLALAEPELLESNTTPTKGSDAPSLLNPLRVARSATTSLTSQYTDTTGTVTLSVSFEVKFVVGMFPGAPVHASAPQALRRPTPSDASLIERYRDATLLFLGHKVPHIPRLDIPTSTIVSSWICSTQRFHDPTTQCCCILSL